MSNRGLNFVEQNQPFRASNIPWRDNRLVAGFSYRQDTFKRTIPTHATSLPNAFAQQKVVQPAPAWMNAPHLTKADVFAQRFIAQKKLSEKVDAYAENLQVLQPGTQPWKMPQKAVTVGEGGSRVQPMVAPNFFSGRTGPPDTSKRYPKVVVSENALSGGRAAPLHNTTPSLPFHFVQGKVVHEPVQSAKEARVGFNVTQRVRSAELLTPGVSATINSRKVKTGIAEEGMHVDPPSPMRAHLVGPHVGYNEIWLDQRHVNTGVASRTVQPIEQARSALLTIPSATGHVHRSAASRHGAIAMIGPAGGLRAQAVTPLQNRIFHGIEQPDVLMDEANVLPGYTAFEDMPPNYEFTGTRDAAVAGFRRPRRPARALPTRPPRYVPPTPRSVIPHTSVTTNLPGGVRIEGLTGIGTPTRSAFESHVPVGSSRTRDAGWFEQGIDDVPSAPMKRKGGVVKQNTHVKRARK